MPDLLQVVVLAADADALLRVGNPLVRALPRAEEDFLELVHSGVGEEKRRVRRQDHGRAGDNLVPLGFEEVQKGLTNFRRGHDITPYSCCSY